MARAQAKQDALSARIAALALPEGLRPARDAALARLSGMGLPLRREEYWIYTDPARLNAAEPPALAAEGEADFFAALDRARIVFTDGAFDAAASDDLAQAGVEIETLSDAASRDIHWVRDFYGSLETQGQTPVARPFAALNTAFAADGVVIRVTAEATRPVELVYRSTGTVSDPILHHCVKVEGGAALTLLEVGFAGARYNTTLEVDVADGGRFNHIRTQGRAHERVANTHLFARVGAEAVFKSFTLSANGILTRNEAVIELAGAAGVAHIAGAAIGEAGFHHDDTVFITHGAPGCESRQVYKKVLKNGAVGVFQGKILVRQVAQKTDGYQISQSLLLDDDSQFLAKPELEIYADDVKCSHGSTSGAIDETGLFYLRSRGVPEAEARVLLVLAFLAEALQEIEDETIAEEIRSRLESWLL